MNSVAPQALGPTTRRVLCIDDDVDYLTLLAMALRMPEVTTLTAASAEEALHIVRSGPIDLILTDIQMPGPSGFEFIRTVRAEGITAPILVLTAQGSIQGAVEALKLGARDYLTKPIDPERLRRTVAELLQDPIAESNPQDPAGSFPSGFYGMLGDSPRMTQVFDRIRRVAATDGTVLVVGESGTGKELVARAIHACSPRAEGPFVPVHTGAIPRELIASELFGHERGSFTGAVSAVDGKFDAAMKGTLFLDEIGTMDLAVQVALLRVLETFQYTRVGGRRERQADVRVLAASNRSLAEMVREGSFREDLYYRINVFTIALPPLRERTEDIPVLAAYFLHRFALRHRSPARALSPLAMQVLLEHPWPGNVRELRNVMEQTAVFARGEEVRADEVRSVVGTQGALPPRPTAPAWTAPVPVQPSVPVPSSVDPALGVSVVPEVTLPPPPPPADVRDEPLRVVTETPDARMIVHVPIGTTIADAERTLILRTLDAVAGNKQKAARFLGISRRCLYNKLAVYAGTDAAIPFGDKSEP